MRIIISVIVIIILLFFLLLLIISNYTTETFINIKDLEDIKNYKGKVTDTYDTIDNPIEDNLLPINPNEKIKLTEYEVIDIYKNIVERPPNIQELKKHAYLSNSELKEFLFNSPEYDKLIKTQNNDVNSGIEGAIAKRNIINRIIAKYSTIYKNELPVKMMIPLRDCFIHLQLNEFLFTAMLESLNYKKFEVDVLSTYVLTKKVLLQLFNKHFNTLELKLLAQDKINELNRNKNIISSEIEKIKDELLTTAVNLADSATGTKQILDNIKSSFPNVYDELMKSITSDTSKTNDTTSKTDIDILNDYLKSKEKYQNKKESFNSKEIITDKKESFNSKEIITKELFNNNDDEIIPDKIIENLELSKSTERIINKLPEHAELYVRVYEPMKHNNSYKLPDGYKAPICTSLGQKELTQPIFTESKLLFQGTDLETAFTETQIGSIMPKFIYKEYKDVKIN